jgi:hypothetical protein
MNKNQLFPQLIYIFHASAIQALGKVPNPVTNKIERNLEQARQAIEMIEMIRDKTKGNLSPDEERFLNSSLTELRLNYVDEMNKETVSK